MYIRIIRRVCVTIFGWERSFDCILLPGEVYGVEEFCVEMGDSLIVLLSELGYVEMPRDSFDWDGEGRPQPFTAAEVEKLTVLIRNAMVPRRYAGDGGSVARVRYGRVAFSLN